MAANYLTLAQVKARRGLSDADTPDDQIIGELIEAVSRKVDDHCNVAPGAFVGEVQTRYYTAYDSECLYVDNLLSVGSLVTDNGYNRNYSATWSSGHYDLYPYNAILDDIPFREIRRVVTATLVFPSHNPRGVRLTGTFGYSPTGVPPQIREACLTLINRFLARRDSPYGVIGSGEIGTFRISPIDPDVQNWLEAFRDRGMA